MKTVLVDDHPMFTEGLSEIVSTDGSLELVATTASFSMAQEAILRHQPDLLITDVSLPDGNGIDLIQVAKAANSQCRVLVLSMHSHVQTINQALTSGAMGYAIKDAPKAEILRALDSLKNGIQYVSPSASAALFTAQTSGQSLLTKREVEIIQLIAEEKSNKEIAAQLFISVRTVETHRKNIFKKTDTSSLIGLMKFAKDQHII